MIGYRPLFFVVVAFYLLNSTKCERPNMKSVEPCLEYHFHTYFNASDNDQVNQAIQLRNEIIANCAVKKIIAIPLHWHYDPENPVIECKLNLFENEKKAKNFFYVSQFSDEFR